MRGRDMRGRRGKDARRIIERRKERGKETATRGHSESLPLDLLSSLF
jgi:hypothetical protein